MAGQSMEKMLEVTLKSRRGTHVSLISADPAVCTKHDQGFADAQHMTQYATSRLRKSSAAAPLG